MFLIKCKEDGSIVPVDDDNVVCSDSVNVGEHVKFYYSGKQYRGEILMAAVDPESIEKELTRIKKERQKKSIRKDTSKNSSTPQPCLIIDGKRTRTPPAKYASQKSNPSLLEKYDNPKVVTKTVANKGNDTANLNKCPAKTFKKTPDNKNASSTTESSDEDDFKVIKKQRKSVEKAAASAQAKAGKEFSHHDHIETFSKHANTVADRLTKLASVLNAHTSDGDVSYNTSKDSDDTISADNSQEKVKDESDSKVRVEVHQKRTERFAQFEALLSSTDDQAEEQLFGKDCGHEMVELGNNVWCKKVCWRMIEGRKRMNPKRMVSNLMDGIFKPEGIQKCTLTGKAPMTLGDETKRQEVHPLIKRAKDAIIDLTTFYAKKKGWEEPRESDLFHSMSDHLGAMKRKFEKRA